MSLGRDELWTKTESAMLQSWLNGSLKNIELNALLNTQTVNIAFRTIMDAMVMVATTMTTTDDDVSNSDDKVL